MADRQDSRICDYVARKDDPSNWHGDDPDDWVLGYEAPLGLEQEVWECPHETLDGEEHCVFHTDPEDVPDDVDEGQRFVEAVNEASAVDDEETARRRKEFVGATFGAFDIEEATLDAGDEHPIRLDHARFTCGVNAENTVFEHNVLATEARFETGDGETTTGTGDAEFREGEVSFYKTEFREGAVSFYQTEFGEGAVSFELANFGEGAVSFDSAEFGEGEVSFYKTEFGEGEVSFELANFGEGEVSFRSAEFGEGEVSFDFAGFSEGEVSFRSAESGEGEVSFNYAEFEEGEVSFYQTEFGEGEVSFNYAEFGEGEVSFNYAEFGEGEVSFESAGFGEGEVSFNYAEFGEGEVSFESAGFGEGEVSFESARFGEGEVSFNYAEFGEREVSFSYSKFGEGRVSFESAGFGEGRVSFRSAEFGEGEVSFRSAEFGEGEVSFRSAEFGEGRVSFGGAEFGEGAVSFNYSEFGEGAVSFDEAKFGEGAVSFGGAEFGEGAVSFYETEFGEGAVLFYQTEFGEGEVSFRSAEFGEGAVSFDSATVAASLSFLNTRFDVESTMVLSDAEFRDDVTFGSSGDESVPYVQHSLDFSGATFRSTLEFRGGTDSTTGTEQSDPGEPQFDFAFAGDVDFSNVTFENGVDFSAIRFPPDADFTGANLENADFERATLDNANFEEATLLEANLLGATAANANFREASLEGADLERSDLSGAILERTTLSNTDLFGTDLRGAELYGARFGDAAINIETELADDGGYCVYDPRSSHEYDPGGDEERDVHKTRKAMGAYQALEELARANAFPDEQGTFFAHRQDMLREQMRIRDSFSRREYWFAELQNAVFRHGESFSRVVGWALVTMAFFSFVYPLGGWLKRESATGEVVQIYTYDAIVESPLLLWESFNHSARLFLTGTGPLKPVGTVGEVLMFVESLIAPILLALIVFVLGRRAAR